jgi:hypothetical protein
VRLPAVVAARRTERAGLELWPAARAELERPTEGMAAAFAALEPEHRALLVAMLDAPPPPVAERDLAAALHRHQDGPLSDSPHELVDRLSDHFLRVLP